MKMSFIEIGLVLVLPIIFFAIPLFLELHFRAGDIEGELNEHRKTMVDEEMTEIMISLEQFITQHYRTVLFAGHILAKKPLINLFKMEVIQTKAGTLPIFYAENPHLEYKTRLSKFLDLKEKVKKLGDESV